MWWISLQRSHGYDRSCGFLSVAHCLKGFFFLLISFAALSADMPQYDGAQSSNPRPTYPSESRRAREQGQVLIHVFVDDTGAVTSLNVLETSGFPRLDNAAVSAVRSWRFIPAQKDGAPVSSSAIVPVVFLLDGASGLSEIDRIKEVMQLIQARFVEVIPTEHLVAGCYKRVSNRVPEITLDYAQVQKPGALDENLGALGVVASLLDHVRRQDPGAIASRRLVTECIRGALESTDDQAVLIDLGEQLSPVSNAGATGSIGIEFRNEPRRGIKIVQAFNGSPAEQAGLKTGDVIVAIDGAALTAVSAGEIQRRLWGPLGSIIELRVEREAVSHVIKVQRGLIQARPQVNNDRVSWKWIEPHTAYVRVPHLRATAPAEVANAIKTAYQESQQNLNGIVLDLRGNTGGLLYNAAGLSAILMPARSRVATLKGRTTNSDVTLYASKSFAIRPSETDYLEGLPSATKNVPLIVVVNAATASGGEIVAASIQFNGRGKIIGEKTAGLGRVRSTFPLKDGSRVELSTGTLFRADGKPLTGNPVAPDIVATDRSPADGEGDVLAYALSVLKTTQSTSVK